MLRSLLRDLRAHPGRLAMTLLAIVLSVSFVVASWVFADSLSRTAADARTRDDAGVLVAAAARPFTPAERDRLAALPGVTAARGVVVGRAGFVQRDGKLGGLYDPGRGGTDWDGTRRFALVAGRAPAGAGEVALEEEAAEQGGRRPGDTVRVQLAGGRTRDLTVTGLFTYRMLAGAVPALALPEATALELLGGGFAQVELDGPDPAALAAAVRAARPDLPADAVALATDLAAKRRAAAREEAEEIRLLLLAFAAVAVLVGALVIANTFTILVAQRTRQFALLRAVGASRRQVRRAILAEAAVVGLLGATAGGAAGVGLAYGGLVLLRAAGEEVTLALGPAGLAVGYAIGLGVTLLAAYGSARRAATIAPVAALRTDATVRRRSLALRGTAGVLALAGGAAVLLVVTDGPLSRADRVAGIGAVLAAWLGVLLIGPLLAGLVLRPLAALTRYGGGPALRLAVRNAIRDPRRTAATASALMIGVALVCAFATIGASAERLLIGDVARTLPAGTAILRAPGFASTLDGTVADRARAAAGVDRVAAVRPLVATVDGEPDTLQLVDAAPLATLVTPTIVSGAASARGGALVMDDPVGGARARVGDRLRLGLPDGRAATVPVVGTYRAVQGFAGTLVDAALVPGAAAVPPGTVYAGGPDPAAARAGLRAAFADRPDVLVEDREATIAQLGDAFALTLRVLAVLLGMGVVIAVFGVVNTLALSVHERTREIGVARAVGAGRRLIRRTVRGESTVLAGYGAVLGVAVGLAVGAIMQHLLLDAPVLDAVVPVGTVAAALGGLVAAGVLAAWWPARRAARTPVLTAIATE
ncbi:membrane protein [Pilimelia anulata]|uniref:Membrane protein n=1 Tax=Pilimelia anulata TaxID=53371 RepID=A0A8J3FB71_9ACTN|nr:FtsX-like permease family protein [Pilimelia anulata]GGK03541.1 membrane protein [Pilimelia anulata]